MLNFSMSMQDKAIILNLLNKFSNDHKDVSWKMECAFSDGIGTTINLIKMVAQPDKRTIGIFTYRVETGIVLFCNYKKMEKADSENIVDLLLDMMNYSEV